MKRDTDLMTALSISAVERETGLSKDTLRVWERRYGFPQPLRDANGDRVYPLAQVERLRTLRRLLDKGLRPGKVILLNDQQLATVSGKLGEPVPMDARHAGELGEFVRLVKRHQGVELKRRLTQALLRHGLQRFVIETVAPLNVMIGEAWMRGELAVFEEHMYTEVVQNVLRNAISGERLHGNAPKVVLSTLPSEQHGLGLLMVEGVLTVEGVECISLGTQLPVADIAEAAVAHRADVVAVSSSSAYPLNQLSEGIANLRRELSATVDVWVGGGGAAKLKREIAGVKFINSLAEVAKLAAEWRGTQNAPSPAGGDSSLALENSQQPMAAAPSAVPD